MAVFENFRDMYDVSLKPRLLRTLLKEHVPDENRLFLNPSDLLLVVSALKTHALLTECYAESVDQKLVLNWKSAVDSWVERLLLLLSSNMPDKCWAGISLLGVTCEECRSDRFLASYSIWFQNLLSHIQPPEDSHILKLASCTSLSGLFTRLSGFSSVKKDAISHAGKVVQSVLKLLNEDSSEAVWEGAIHLLHTILVFFPSSVHRHYEAIEATVVSKIRSGKCSITTLKKLAHCLSLLPKSRGDEYSWSMMMQKILFTINVHLDDAFQGFEEETKSKEAMRLLAPPGKDPPPPLGGHTTAGEALDNKPCKYEPTAMSSVSTLIYCCSSMLTSNNHVQVSVPVRSLLALVGRVLMVDGSVSQAFLPFMTAMQQQLVCSQLPDLHNYSLDLLTAIIKGTRSQLLPNSAEIVRLMIEYFGRCASPELRTKVYSIVKILLISMGVGIAVYLAPAVIQNASLDLNSIGYDTSEDPAETVPQPSTKKRKQVSTIKSREGKLETVGLEKEARAWKPATPISVKIAALQALEALLTVGGAAKSECWRLDVDLLLITVATTACGGRWGNEGTNIYLSNEHTSAWADFQLASLRALLASFLSRARVSPPYLAQGLALFRRGKQEIGTKLAEFCSHALLTLEVLIHPRARAIADYGYDEVDHNLSNTHYSISEKRVVADPDPDPDEDALYISWQEKGEEIETPVTDSGDKNVTEQLPLAEKLISLNRSSDSIDMEKNKQDAITSFEKNVEIIADNNQFAESHKPFSACGSENMDFELGKVASDQMEGERILSTKSKALEQDDDSFPDIVDADPDSDSGSD